MHCGPRRAPRVDNGFAAGSAQRIFKLSPKRKTFLRERSSELRRAASLAVEHLSRSAHSWRLALSALELIDLGLQALKFQALFLEPLRLPQFGFTLFDLQAMRFEAFLAPTLPL